MFSNPATIPYRKMTQHLYKTKDLEVILKVCRCKSHSHERGKHFDEKRLNID